MYMLGSVTNTILVIGWGGALFPLLYIFKVQIRKMILKWCHWIRSFSITSYIYTHMLFNFLFLNYNEFRFAKSF